MNKIHSDTLMFNSLCKGISKVSVVITKTLKIILLKITIYVDRSSGMQKLSGRDYAVT